MLPTIWTGARVRVERCREEDIRRGDVVLIDSSDGLMLHRAVRRVGDRWITQGDGVAVADVQQSRAEILGRVDGLVIGRWNVPFVPRSLQRAVRYGYSFATPLLRGTYLGVRDRTRPVRRQIERRLGANALRPFRSTLHGLRVEPLRPELVADFRSYMMRRGAQPTAKRVAQWAALADEENGCCVVARARRGIVGSMLILERADAQGAHLALDLWVNRAFRGLGLASQLVETILHRADERGYHRVFAQVREDNHASQRIFTRAGFRVDRDTPAPEGYLTLVRTSS